MLDFLEILEHNESMEQKIVITFELLEKMAGTKGYLADFLYGQMEAVFQFVLKNRLRRAKIEYEYMVAVFEEEKSVQ